MNVKRWDTSFPLRPLYSRVYQPRH